MRRVHFFPKKKAVTSFRNLNKKISSNIRNVCKYNIILSFSLAIVIYSLSNILSLLCDFVSAFCVYLPVELIIHLRHTEVPARIKQMRHGLSVQKEVSNLDK